MVKKRSVAKESPPQFLPWRTFQGDALEGADIIESVLALCSVPKIAEAALATEEVGIVEGSFQTIVLTVAEMKLRNVASPKSLFIPSVLAAWNKRHARDLLGDFELGVMSIAEWLQVRKSYQDQPRGESLFVACATAVNAINNSAFSIGRDSDGNTWVHLNRFTEGSFLEQKDRILFRLNRAPSITEEDIVVPRTIDAFDDDGELRSLEEIECDLIRIALANYRNTSEAARRLKMGRSTLYRKLNELSMH